MKGIKDMRLADDSDSPDSPRLMVVHETEPLEVTITSTYCNFEFWLDEDDEPEAMRPEDA